jgi:multidrug efflux system outer membrane protein
MTASKTYLLITAVLLFITGCTVGPDYKQPTIEMPKEWSPGDVNFILSVPDANNHLWWKVFNDTELDSLIARAVENNRDIRAAIHRIDESRALRDYASGQYFPDIEATASYTRSQASKDGLVQSAKQPKAINLHSAGFDFQWEVDLFGKLKRAVESADASYQASIEDYHDVMITMLSEVCINYIELRTTQARIAYALDNIRIQQETLQLTKNLYQSEIVSELDVRQAEFNLSNTQAEIPTLLAAEAAGFNRLAVLTGQMPGELKSQLSPYKKLLWVDEQVKIGLPAELLRQRPDIRRAERELAAQNAQIGFATADLYPYFQLSGVFDIESRTISGLGNINNKAYSFGPTVGWKIFDGNRIRNMIKFEDYTTRQLLANWENTVLSAVEDVDNAVASYTQERMRKKSLEESVIALQRSVEIVNSLYRSGLTDFQNVLDTQRSLFVQQDKLAVSQGLVLQDLVQIYKSFGFGW